MSAPFEAQYPGTCTDCEERFEAGPVIRMTSGGAAHDECPSPIPVVNRAVCPRCFMEKSVSGAGACEAES